MVGATGTADSGCTPRTRQTMCSGNKKREAGMKELERSRQDIVRQREMQSLVVGEADTQVKHIDWKRELRREQE